MKAIPDRLVWIAYRRCKIARSVTGFSAHWRTYASPGCQFSEYNRLYTRTRFYDVSLGRFTYVAGGARAGSCSIGAFCSIGPEAIVGGLGKHPTRWLTTHPSFFSTLGQTGLTFSEVDAFDELPWTSVGNDVWIGARAIVLDGVSVGDGAIVAAGAVVNKDVPPYAIFGGIPARIIRYRFDEETIAGLLSWKWWDLPTETLRYVAPDFVRKEHWSLEDVQRLRKKSLSITAGTITENDHPKEGT